jgi:cation diffusion facilitator CzcD-associated flavoprotein CzcO
MAPMTVTRYVTISDWGRTSAVMDDIAVIGTGPYGLSVASHLRVRGVEPRVFGHPMSFWERQMPRGMLVRSPWQASSISDPQQSHSLDAYEAEQPQPFSRPLPGAELARYGRWFQVQAVPDVDTRLISTIEKHGESFTLTAEDGERRHARRVVIATGLHSFAYRPPQFESLRNGLATHSMEMTEPEQFAGRSVVVIGSGQSAVESAALVLEAGANVELIARAPLIRWLTRGERIRRIDPLVRRILYAPTDVGPAGLSWIVAMPNLFRRLPIKPRERLAYRCIRPAATGWLVDRTAGVTFTLGRQVTQARPDAGGARLTLDDGSHRRVDHVILATGYQIDVTREPLIDASIRERLRVRGGYPVLGRGFESSIPGLHFVGAYSAWSFGPIMRFVVGTKFTGPAVAEHIEAAVTRGSRPTEGLPREAQAIAQTSGSK